MGRPGLLAVLAVGFAAFVAGGWWLSRAADRNLHTVGTILFAFGIVVILVLPTAFAVHVHRRRALEYPPPPDGPKADYWEPPD
jgi:hypothetical protein